jgi:UDP-glucose 4-epimerase
MFGAKRKKERGDWRKLHNLEFNTLYSSSRIIRMIKSIKNNEMGEEYSTRRKEDKCTQFCLENLKEITTW